MLKTIVSSQWLNQNRTDSNLIILDASQKGNKSGLTTDFANLQIKGAKPFDIKNDFSDQSSEFPNTLLSPQDFKIACRNLGINKRSKIVVYDNLGIYTSPRVWWMFKTMGHDAVVVLDGGLPDWVKCGFETEHIQVNKTDKGDFVVNFQSQKVVDFDFVKKNTSSQSYLVIDARSEGRFQGLTPEPRKGLRGGNIPNSINIPFQKVLEDGKLKSKAELSKLFNEMEVQKQPLVFSCGSGITACIVLLAHELCLENETAVYDGSWTEWATLEK
jgi:thiosulfate/3-mercaptopyruvate sulfurtransferase